MAPRSAAERRARNTTASTPMARVAPAVASTRLWIGLYVGIFLIAQAVLFLAFNTAGGDSRVRREMLQRADAAADAGRQQERLEVLLDYGKRWPGAYQTGDFQKRLGDATAALGEHQQAAEHYMTSASLRPDEPGVYAAAGEQWRLAGDAEQALNAFAMELGRSDPTNAMAHHRLGLAAAERGAWVEAMRHHAALPDDWALAGEWTAWLAKLSEVTGESGS